MSDPLGWRDVLAAVAIFVIAGCLRAGYILACLQEGQPPPYQVQDTPSPDAIKLVQNVANLHSFSGPAPLSHGEGPTAHLSPGYPTVIGNASRWIGDTATTARVILWTQCSLGASTAMLYVLVARLLFNSAFVAFLAGLLAACHPFWIVNVAETQDGVLASFALAVCLLLGTFAGQRASPLASFGFGLSLAGLALVRAALLPFAFIGCCWILLRLRRQPRSWLCALLVFLGFGNGLAPWTIRNFQAFGEIVPITDTAFLHLWVGNSSASWGGPLDNEALAATLNSDRLHALEAEANQPRRYRMLAEDVKRSIQFNPAGALKKRIKSAIAFVAGAAWFQADDLVHGTSSGDIPSWITSTLPPALAGTLLALLPLALLGWRWHYGLDRQANLASLALIWIPLPYILAHAELYSGPRLPLDGVLLCYAAFALVQFLPFAARLTSANR